MSGGACYFTDFRIGTSVATLRRLLDRGITNPVDWTFLPYAVVNVRGDGRSIGDGFPSASWVFDDMDQAQLDRLLAFFTVDTDASVATYIRTPAERGAKAYEKDYACIMHRPTFTEGKTAISDSGFPIYSEVVIRFTRLVEQ